MFIEGGQGWEPEPEPERGDVITSQDATALALFILGLSIAVPVLTALLG